LRLAQESVQSGCEMLQETRNMKRRVASSSEVFETVACRWLGHTMDASLCDRVLDHWKPTV